MSDPTFEFQEGYDVAQVCLNGHIVNFFAGSQPERNENFCSACGERTIVQCPHCKTKIRGQYHEFGAESFQPDIPKTTDSFAGPCIALEWSPLRSHVCVLCIQDDEFPGSTRIEITDEKLLGKLRSVNGQFVHDGHPVFYYENLMSTADY
jgi:hypothetical protein